MLNPSLSDFCNRNGYDKRVYLAWCSMRWRCNNPKRRDYPHYGGRGIKVCERWDTFTNFAADMGPHPGKGWSLDRINTNGNYRRGNCRWASLKTQNRNRRGCLTQHAVEEIKRRYIPRVVTQAALAAEYGVDRATIAYVVGNKTWQ